MDVKQALLTKRAVRKFTTQPIPETIIHEILNAGRRAQSAKNSQPWRLIAITDRETLIALAQMGDFAGHLAGAALGVAILTPPPMQRWSIMFDAGQCAAYMQLAGWSLGIGSCPATIYRPEAARQLLGFPTEWCLNVVLSFGYPADPNQLTAPPRGKGRRPLPDIVHFDAWTG